jgi:hypothetical protein
LHFIIIPTCGIWCAFFSTGKVSIFCCAKWKGCKSCSTKYLKNFLTWYIVVLKNYRKRRKLLFINRTRVANIIKFILNIQGCELQLYLNIKQFFLK